MTGAPWTFDEAREFCRGAARAQEAAEEALVKAAREFAAAEEAYRLALAKKIVELHDSGVAWTVAPDLARGDAEVARLRRERDIAEGVREAMTHALWRMNANRRDAQRFTDWSMRRELAEAYDQTPEPSWSQPIGGTRERSV